MRGLSGILVSLTGVVARRRANRVPCRREDSCGKCDHLSQPTALVASSTGYGDVMSDDILLIDTVERVRTLTLNRPKSRNALSAALRDRFFGALADAETDNDFDVVILTGSDPVFCAGLDLKELGGQSALPDISPRWPPMTKPVIGAINGAAVTGGLELVLYCDIVIASEHARFADTHARVGLLPTWGLSVRLPQKVGVGLARRMSLTGDYLSAADALRAGLVTEVVPHDQLLTTARQVAATIVGNNQNAVRALLASCHRIDESQNAAGLWLEAMAAKQFRTSGDDIAAHREAVLQRGRSQVR
jgi:enoyl-CoA hydratase/carnithine racemase